MSIAVFWLLRRMEMERQQRDAAARREAARRGEQRPR